MPLYLRSLVLPQLMGQIEKTDNLNAVFQAIEDRDSWLERAMQSLSRWARVAAHSGRETSNGYSRLQPDRMNRLKPQRLALIADAIDENTAVCSSLLESLYTLTSVDQRIPAFYGSTHESAIILVRRLMRIIRGVPGR